MATVLVKKIRRADGKMWGYQFLNEGKPLKGKNGHPLFAFESKSTPGNYVVREWDQKRKQQINTAPAFTLVLKEDK
ncbi:hypothetical protein LCGC14_2504660 [marine sediment metagenome]|uniref:Uncharacterized protein n=1 Tax=marine sediment metagenome TaxID=412755 RepID=A0A0F9DUH1_9ZZZZ